MRGFSISTTNTVKTASLIAFCAASSLAHANIILSNADFSNHGMPPPSWSVVSGNAQAWSNNSTLVGTASSSAWSVRQVSTDSVEPDTIYQFSVDLGCNTGSANGSGTWTATIGTWDGSSFTPLANASRAWNLTRSGNNLSFTGGSEESKTFQFSTGESPSTDPVAVQLSVDGALAWMAMDDVSLTSVSLANNSFEIAPGGGTPSNLQNVEPEGWSRTLTSGSEGVYYNATSSDQTWSYAFGPSTVGYLSQITPILIEANRDYKLITDFARNASSGTANLLIEGWVNGTRIGTMTSTATHQNFQSYTLQLTADQLSPYIGQALEIRIGRSGGNKWLGLDKVRVEPLVVVPGEIDNPSFETAPGGGTPGNLQNAAPEGWSRTLTGGTEGVYYNGATSDQNWSYAFNPSTTGYLSQVTQITIEADTEYTILSDFARNASSGTAEFMMEGRVNGALIDSVSSELKHQDFLTYGLHLTADQLASHIGQNLEIRVGRSGGNNWLGIDHVRVTTRSKDTLEFMVMGDSITQGRNNGKLSYRYELWKDLVDLGLDFDMVGSHNFVFQGPAAASSFPDYQGKTFDRDNEGHWNWDTDQVLNGYSESTLTSYSPNPSTGTETLSVWLKGYQADYVLIALGRNDCNRGQGAANYALRMGQIIDALQADNPHVTIFLASVLDASSGGDETAYNAELPGLASNKSTATSRVIHANIGSIPGQTAFVASTHTYDNVHPNVAGEIVVADHWDATLTPYLTQQDVIITAPDTTATELNNSPGTIRVELPYNHKSHTVSYTLSGTADQGTDYTLSSGSVTIPANATYLDLFLTPISDSLAEGAETATFTAVAGAGYGLGDPRIQAHITVEDHPVELEKIATFGSIANANDPAAADDADWDRDGVANLTEIALGTAADNSADTPTQSALSSDNLVIYQYALSSSAMGLTVTPRYSTTLEDQSWADMTVIDFIETLDGLDYYQAELSTPGDKTFFHLNISR